MLECGGKNGCGVGEVLQMARDQIEEDEGEKRKVGAVSVHVK